MQNKQTFLVIILGIVIFTGGLVGGIVIQNYLTPQSGSPGGSSQTSYEDLEIESYTPRLLTRMAVEFNLTNTGTTDLEIEEVKLNGQANETTEGIPNAWNGTAMILDNGESGTLFVYIPCYRDVINSSMPQMSAQNPTSQEMEAFEEWAWNYTCTFTFKTRTNHEYGVSIKGLGFELGYALMGLSSVSYMYTGENVKISNIIFNTGGTSVTMTFSNLGTTTVSIRYIQVNDGLGWVQTWTATGSNGDISGNGQLPITFNYAWQAGLSYEFRAVTAKGTTFSQTQVAS